MRILLCTDGSAHGQTALRFGALLAGGSPEPATLLGVVEHPGDRAQVEQALEQGREWLSRAQTPQIKIRQGNAAEEILDEAAGHRYDLIVVGARGRRGITRFLLGSTSERVARHADPPVLIVQGERQQLARILACTGGKEQGLAAVELGARVATLTGATVTVLHVMSQLVAAPLLPEAGALQIMPQTPAPPDPEQLQFDALEADTEALIDQRTPEGAHLQKALAILNDHQVPARARVRRGLVIDEILAEAHEGDQDLVIVGTQSAEGWMRFLLNDIGHEILCCLDRPVLISKA